MKPVESSRPRVMLALGASVNRPAVRRTFGESAEIVADCPTAPEAVSSTLRLRPEVSLIASDLCGGGLEASLQIVQHLPEARVILLAQRCDDSQAVVAMRSGMCGYLPAATTAKGLLAAARGVALGEIALSRRHSMVLARELTRVDRTEPARGDEMQLTETELLVLRLATRQADPRTMGDELGLSEIAVRRTLSSARVKLARRDQAQALILARALDGVGTFSVPPEGKHGT